jgi:exodeoxyribonuclease VII small subunit
MTKTVKKESFEGKLAQLETLVQELEGGDKGLEESLGLFEKGVRLSRELSKSLEEAKSAVEVLIKEGGKLTKKPLEE